MVSIAAQRAASLLAFAPDEPLRAAQLILLDFKMHVLYYLPVILI
jgi:hypothetical protein